MRWGGAAGGGGRAVGRAREQSKGAKEPTTAPSPFLGGNDTQSAEKHVNGIHGTNIVE